jgi:hypothetical protein
MYLLDGGRERKRKKERERERERERKKNLVRMWLQHNYHSPIFGICHIKKSDPKKIRPQKKIIKTVKYSFFKDRSEIIENFRYLTWSKFHQYLNRSSYNMAPMPYLYP